MKKEIRTRFAPSPTGYLHIGGLRTALFSYAYAKSQNGSFILRIEDTDQKRLIPGAREKIYETLKRFGLNWDEGPEAGGPHSPYIQSERVKTGLYKNYAEKLVREGLAYFCFCKAKGKDEIKKEHNKKIIEVRDPCRNLPKEEVEEKLNSGIKPAIRLKVPENETVKYFDFVLKKEISWETRYVDEAMLLKSDGFPTYHLAVVVDDMEMGITHIIRGRDWLPSTPIHLILFKYLNFPLPQIGHLTDILDPSGGKLSKRKGSVSCEDFFASGYLPQAILNFVMLLGWAPKDNREFFTLEDFVENFQKGNLQTGNPVFNRVKLDWFNGYYIRNTEDAQLADITYEFTNKKFPLDLIKRIVPLIKNRINTLADIEKIAGFILEDKEIKPLFSTANYEKHISPETLAALKSISPEEWNLDNINKTLTGIIEKNNFKVGDFYMDLRGTLSGSKITPPINESIVILGKEKTIKKLEDGLRKFQESKNNK